MSAHHNVYGKGDGRVARCSCGQTYEGRSAVADMAGHLITCPDEIDAIEPSDETERWAALAYSDRTMTLEQHRERNA